jgi:hypothetical protein
MMKPAVRVVNALPLVLKNAAVAAFAVAASAGGTTVPSRPWPSLPTLRIVDDMGEPGIGKKTEHIAFAIGDDDVYRFPSDVAAEAACCRIVCTSVCARLVVA